MSRQPLELSSVQFFLVDDSGCTFTRLRWAGSHLWHHDQRVAKDAFIHVCRTLFSGADDVPNAIKYLRDRGYARAGWHGELAFPEISGYNQAGPGPTP